MLEKIQKLLDRVESRIALWQIFAGSGILSSGAISAWIASATDWLNAYGPIAWWGAGLLGALIALLLCFLVAKIRQAWINASAIKEWKDRVDQLNPVDPQFNGLRMKFQDVVHPLSKMIKNKKFIDCELMGPANLYFANNVKMTGVSLK